MPHNVQRARCSGACQSQHACNKATNKPATRNVYCATPNTFCNAQRAFCNGTARPTNANRSRYAGDVMPDVIATFKDYLHDFETDLEKDFFKKFMEQVLKHLVFR